MRWVWLVLVAALAGGPSRAQELLYHQPQILDPAAGGIPILLDGDGVPVGAVDRSRGAVARDPAGVPRRAGVRGTVGGFGQDNQANASVGFTYLVPLWSFRTFQVPVPPGFEGRFPAFGGSGPVDSRFAYAPRANIDYYVADLDATIGATGTFINLTGRVDRQVSGTTTPAGLLTANGNLTLISANIPEFGRRFAFLDLFPDWYPGKHGHGGGEGLVDAVVELRIGTRYVSVDQNYTGSLTAAGTGGAAGASVATRFSSQTFRGVGVTGAATWELPRGDSWVFFSTTRLSAVLGENRRNSNLTVAAPDAAAFAAAEFDSRTVFVPVAELEAGVDWGLELAARLREGLEPPKFTVRVAAVGQYWGGLGPLSAGSTQGFRGTDLFLVGGYVQAGFRY
jgi:hypothetical protein